MRVTWDCDSDTIVRTLPDTPVQLAVERLQQDGLQRVVVLREDVDDGVQRVVARSRHPLGLLLRPAHAQTDGLAAGRTQSWVADVTDRSVNL